MEYENKIFIKKCQNCGCYTESIIKTDDEKPYIICTWCGAEIDVDTEMII